MHCNSAVVETDGAEGRPPDRRSAQVTGWLVPVAVGVLALLAVVGAAAHSGIRLSDRGPLSDQRGPLLAVGGLLLVTDILVILVIRRILRGRRRLEFERPRFSDDDAGPEPWWVRLLSYLIVFTLILLPLLLIFYALRRNTVTEVERDARPPAEVPNVEVPESVLSNAAMGAMVLLSLAVIILGAVISYRQLHRPSPTESIFDVDEDESSEDGDGPTLDGRALASAVDAGEAAIRAAANPREAIIACYAAMEATLAEHGSPRRPTDTPTDLLTRAAAAGLVRSDASAVLTDLFRRARFSRHRMGERDVQAAEAALGRVRADLGVTT